jgi:hypothetical protein
VAAERPRLNVRPQHCTQSMQGDVLKNVMALVIDVIPSCSVTTTARQWPLSAFFFASLYPPLVRKRSCACVSEIEM